VGASNQNDNERHEAIQLPTLSVDGVLRAADCVPRRLLFKIDVEGYEPHVLAGMTETLCHVDWALGYLEVDDKHAAAAGVDLSEFIARLAEQFQLYAFSRQGRLVDLHGADFAALEAVARKTNRRGDPAALHTDLVLLAGHADEPDRFLRSWM